MKVSIQLNGKKHKFTDGDFVESSVKRSRETVEHNFALFPFPHSDFSEYSFDPKKPNALKSFGGDYAAAKQALDSMTPENLRQLVPSTECTSPTEVAAGDERKRKRLVKKKIIYDPSADIVQSDYDSSASENQVSKKNKRGSIYSTKPEINSTFHSTDNRPRAGGIIKPVVGKTNRTKLLEGMEAGKIPGKIAMGNAAGRDYDKAATVYKNKVIGNPEFPVFKTPEVNSLAAVQQNQDITTDHGEESDGALCIDENEGNASAAEPKKVIFSEDADGSVVEELEAGGSGTKLVALEPVTITDNPEIVDEGGFPTGSHDNTEDGVDPYEIFNSPKSLTKRSSGG
jgi:hypothetical protein